MVNGEWSIYFTNMNAVSYKIKFQAESLQSWRLSAFIDILRCITYFESTVDSAGTLPSFTFSFLQFSFLNNRSLQ